MPRVVKRRERSRIEITKGAGVLWGPRGGAGLILPSLSIECDGHSLIGGRRIVCRASAYKGVFRDRENILDLHVDSKDPRSMIKLVRKLREVMPKLKEFGFAGICCDTPNSALKNLLVRALAMEETPISKNAEGRAKNRYRWAVKHLGYPEKYIKQAAKRVVLRFPN